jgi:DNA-binding MarR family transcriptional regulator
VELAAAVRALLQAGRETETVIAWRLGLGVRDVQAMDQLLSSSEPLGPAELSRRLGITTASATALVDRLEEAGHLQRGPHARDRRRLVLRPTGRSRQAILRELSPVIKATIRIADRLSPEEAAVVGRFLRQVTEAIRAFNEGRLAGGDEDPDDGERGGPKTV